jgi:hypothetical protein
MRGEGGEWEWDGRECEWDGRECEWDGLWDFRAIGARR